MFSFGFASLIALMHLSTTVHASINYAEFHTAAKACGKLYFGTATDNPELSDADYVNILKQSAIFGQITPGNKMKWDSIEPQQGVFDFTGGDQVVSFAENYGMLVTGHNLISHSQLPSWVSGGQWTANTLTTVIQNHISGVVSHFGSEIFVWDVINEPFEDDGKLRSDVFYNTLGTSFVGIALRAARAANSNVKLRINEFGLEYAGPKVDAMVNLVQQLQAEGIHIDEIGFQCHYILGKVSASELKVNMERFISLGLTVAVTELDIRILLPATEADLEQQKADYMTVMEVALSLSGCTGITVWDITDKYTWITSHFPGYGAPCLWDANLVHKPAHEGVSESFEKYMASR